MEIQEQIVREIQKLFTTISKTKKYKRGAYGEFETTFDEINNQNIHSASASLYTDEDENKYKLCVITDRANTKIVNAYYLPIE